MAVLNVVFTVVLNVVFTVVLTECSLYCSLCSMSCLMLYFKSPSSCLQVFTQHASSQRLVLALPEKCRNHLLTRLICVSKPLPFPKTLAHPGGPNAPRAFAKSLPRRRGAESHETPASDVFCCVGLRLVQFWGRARHS